MIADRANRRGLLTLDNRTAIAALPLVLANLHPDLTLLDVDRKLAITLLNVTLLSQISPLPPPNRAHGRQEDEVPGFDRSPWPVRES